MARHTTIATERLELRPFRLRDARRFVTLAGDFDVARMTSDIPHPLHPWQSLRWLRQARGEVRFAIHNEGRLIGGVGYFLARPGVGELGFWLGRPHWGAGFATEAARAVVSHAFLRRGLTALTSAHFVDNPPSGRIMAKLGFIVTGRVVAASIARGGDVEAITWQLDREQWEEQRIEPDRRAGCVADERALASP